MTAGMPGATNLFRRLQRFAPTPGRNPREDRLTEALAATFEGAPSVAAYLATAWFGLSPEGDLTVTTQRWVRATERLDLELVFGPVGRPECRIWLEAKVEATPARDQARRYLNALNELAGERRLAWLLPIDVEVKGGSPPEVAERTWQDLALTMREWLRTLDADQRGSYSAHLVEQFIDHLEEEKLAVTMPLDSSDVAAIDTYDLAVRRVGEILRLTASRIHARRPKEHEGRPASPPAPLGFFEHVAKSASWPMTVYYEWRGSHDGLRHDPVGSYAVGAGLTWPAAEAPREAEHTEWFDRRFEEGFERGASRHGFVYLSRYRSLEELVGLPDLAAQANNLADWALETWELLDGDPLG